MDLGRRKSNASILIHRLDHVVHEFLHGRGLDFPAIDLSSLSPKDRMSHARNLEYRHIWFD
jgi:hypothetical protein